MNNIIRVLIGWGIAASATVYLFGYSQLKTSDVIGILLISYGIWLSGSGKSE